MKAHFFGSISPFPNYFDKTEVNLSCYIIINQSHSTIISWRSRINKIKLI